MSIDPKAIDRISGPAWVKVRKKIESAFEIVLRVANGSASELTTIYVKFKVGSDPASLVYAVAWIKTAKLFVIGFRHPEGYLNESFSSAPKGMTYSGLNHYVTIDCTAELPANLVDWAIVAHATTMELVDD